jgi:hypothetical protein
MSYRDSTLKSSIKLKGIQSSLSKLDISSKFKTESIIASFNILSSIRKSKIPFKNQIDNSNNNNNTYFKRDFYQ